ncbi:MAG: periplasmic copper-binding protein [Chloroflexi bacterium]|nr:periplasmic copper-binding protein [Chloroflexota bacterium]
MRAWSALLLAAALLVGATRPALAGFARSGTLLLVSPAGPYTTILAALQAAQEGDTIQVQPGIYPGAIVVDKSVTLEGINFPVIDGGGQGTVVTLRAPGIVFKGFGVRGSGVEPDRDHAGVTVTATQVTVENNRLQDVLFGIFVADAERAVIRGNQISSKVEYEQGRKGDAIRLWYSQDAVVEANHVHDARDIVIWYSENVKILNNTIENGRYGVHLMYCDGARIEHNTLRANSVGIYVMYSNNVLLNHNDIRGHHGSSGYALGFKDADNVLVTGNLLVDNHAGTFLDGAPYSPQGYARFEANTLAYNDIGVLLMPAVKRAEFRQNTFWENIEQMAIQGGGQGQNFWSGNYWSDYSGFDADGDGQGDMPYHAERLFENLTDREPLLQALIYSPAAQAIEMAAAAFPLFRPQPKLIDDAPEMRPMALAPTAVAQPGSPVLMVATALGFLATGVVIGLIGLGISRPRRRIAAALSQPIEET